MIDVKGKLVYDEKCKGLGIKIYAKYLKRGGIFVGDGEYEGMILVTCEISRGEELLSKFDNTSYLGSKYEIKYNYVYESYGFLGMRRKAVPVHISDEYVRVFPKIVERCKKKVEELLYENERKVHEALVTDGLPGSLLELDKDKWSNY